MPKILCFVCAIGVGLRHNAKTIGFKMVLWFFFREMVVVYFMPNGSMGFKKIRMELFLFGN